MRRARLGLLHSPITSRRSASGPVQRLWARLPRRPTSYVTVILARRQGHKSHAGTVHTLRRCSNNKLFLRHASSSHVSNSDLMRPGVHQPVQSSSLANNPGPTPKHHLSRWLRKHSATSHHRLDILGRGHSDLELEDLAQTPRNRPGDNTGPSQESRRGDKRLRKLEWLAAKDEEGAG